MVRRFAYNKIFRTTGMLILFLLLLLYPASKEYSLEDDITIKTSSNIKKQELFLIDKKGYVARCKISLPESNDILYAKKILELLIIDGKYQDKIPNGFKAILPVNTKINDVSIKNNDITIDLSEELLELKNEDEDKALELITYNLTTIPNVNNVYININNKPLTEFKSGKTVKRPLTRKDGVNIDYEASVYKNTNLVTVYYVCKNNNGYYYVPVSKITNDNRDKIKIIVDELTSAHTYETTLMSFLNYNTKLISYNIKDDVMTLNFNNYLFDDESQKSILEEVIYSISLSVRDNYDLKEVVFNVDGNEITKSVIKNIE